MNIVKEVFNLVQSKGVVHRDLKPENILIDEQNCCKISNLTFKLGDFNVSSYLEGAKDEFTKTEGTIYFYAPECCQGKSAPFAAKPVDIWALGVSLFIMTYRALPYNSKDNNIYEIINMISSGE